MAFLRAGMAGLYRFVVIVTVFFVFGKTKQKQYDNAKNGK